MAKIFDDLSEEMKVQTPTSKLWFRRIACNSPSRWKPTRSRTKHSSIGKYGTTIGVLHEIDDSSAEAIVWMVETNACESHSIDASWTAQSKDSSAGKSDYGGAGEVIEQSNRSYNWNCRGRKDRPFREEQLEIVYPNSKRFSIDLSVSETILLKAESKVPALLSRNDV